MKILARLEFFSVGTLFSFTKTLTYFFSTFKVRNMFSKKDSMPQSRCSCVVYKFTCAGCNACKIGETTHHICTCVCKHLVSDKAYMFTSTCSHQVVTQALQNLSRFLILPPQVFKLKQNRPCILSGKVQL